MYRHKGRDRLTKTHCPLSFKPVLAAKPFTTMYTLLFSQAILVYDVANRSTFEELEQWLAEAADFGAGGIPVAVCANKVRTKQDAEQRLIFRDG